MKRIIVCAVAVVMLFSACPNPGGGSSGGTDLEMVRITGNTGVTPFQMGSPGTETGRYSDKTQYPVTLSVFYMGKYEVTQEQYKKVMGTNPSGFTTNARLPVEHVSWYDAVEFCNKLSVMEGLTPYYTINKTVDSDTNNTNSPGTLDPYRWLVTRNSTANGYRLPTEAEWEYACRAGTTGPFNFSNGAGWGTIRIETSQANFNGTGPLYNGSPLGTYRATTTVVGTFAANAWGLHDMHGNVSEWCWDWYGTYPGGAQTNPTGAVSGANRVLRGGSWFSNGQTLRSALRYGFYPSYRDFYFGFRLARNG